MTEIQILSIYISIWIVLLAFFYKKNQIFGIGETILAVYGISSIGSLVFYSAWSIVKDMYITLPAFLYLQCCIFIVIFPYLIFTRQLSELTVQPCYNFDRLNIIFKILMPFVLFVLLEYTYATLSLNTSSLGNIYETSYESGGKIHIGYSLTWISQRVYNFVCRLYYVWPILLFESLRNRNKDYKLYILPSLCILCLILSYYVSAQRVGIVRTFMYLFIVFFFYKNTLDSQIIKKIKKYGIISGASLIGLLMVITIVRYSNMQDMSLSFDEWLSLYLGEGPIRFSDHLWNLQKTSDGDTSFSYIKSCLGFNTFLDYYERREFYEGYFGIPTNIFYTFVGDWYQDFGRYWTVFLCFLCSILEYSILKIVCTKRSIGFAGLFALCIITFFVMFGFMFFVYKVAAAQSNIVQSAVALWIIKLYTNNN